MDRWIDGSMDGGTRWSVITERITNKRRQTQQGGVPMHWPITACACVCPFSSMGTCSTQRYVHTGPRDLHTHQGLPTPHLTISSSLRVATVSSMCACLSSIHTCTRHTHLYSTQTHPDRHTATDTQTHTPGLADARLADDQQLEGGHCVVHVYVCLCVRHPKSPARPILTLSSVRSFG
jgi:hypothetical protein